MYSYLRPSLFHLFCWLVAKVPYVAVIHQRLFVLSIEWIFTICNFCAIRSIDEELQDYLQVQLIIVICM